MSDDLPRFDGAWSGPELARTPERWTIELTPDEIDDLDRAITELEKTAIVDITKADAPLPYLASRLAEMRETILHGQGFMLITGFPIERYSLEQAARAFWAVGAHIGVAVSQNAKGHALGHVRDLGFDPNVPSARGYQSNARLPYHCDSGDIVALLSVRTSKSGGLSSLVSSLALYNAMAERRPDLARILMQPSYRDRRDEIPQGRKPWFPMPVFNPHEGRLFTNFVRSGIRKAQRFDEVPRITEQQEEAFDYLDALADDPEFHLDITFGPGDMQFVSNHSILHSRTAFEDWGEPEKSRHLLRLWLACAGGPALPAVYEEQQGLNADGRPLGIHCPGVVLNADLKVMDGGAGASETRLKQPA